MVEQRYRAVMDVLEQHVPVIEVAARYGVTRQSVHNWVRRYLDGGIDALADRSRRPRACPHQIRAEVEARICELRRQRPGWGPRRLEHELARHHEGDLDWIPSRAAIYRALVRNRLIEPEQRRRRRSDYKRWERPAPMQLWQMDLMGEVMLTGQRLGNRQVEQLTQRAAVDFDQFFATRPSRCARPTTCWCCHVTARAW